MATVTRVWAGDDNSLWQNDGTNEWVWTYGDDSSYFGFAVRPRSDNKQVEVTRQWTVSRVNDQADRFPEFAQVEHFVVTVSPRPTQFSTVGGCNLMFTGTKVTEP